MRLFPTKPPFVCRCSFWSWPIFIFLLIFLSPPLPTHSFSVPSLLHSTSSSLTSTPTTTISIPPVPSNTVNPPTAAPPFKTHTHQSQFDHKIIFAVSASALSVMLLLVLIMGCLVKFIGIRFGRQPGSDRALVAASADDDLEQETKEGFVRKCNWDELEKMSLNFSRVIGSGGFSTVFLGDDLRGSGLGAIKIQVGSDYLNRVFHQELEILLNLRHQNIVKLLGYCDEQEKCALVFEYVPNGNLHETLHSRGGGEEQKPSKQSNSSKSSKNSVLSWRNRMGIAFQLAQALEYLHEKCPLQIVHGDVKSANILLDRNQNCKLCDFGSAKMGFSSAIMPSSNGKKKVMMGSPGYTDPQYLRTGIASKKNDVYSYGVIILELVTGMEAFCEEKGQLLTAIVGPTMRGLGGGDGATEVAGSVDPRLGADFDAKEVCAIMSLAGLCLGQTPALRPSATQILQTFLDHIPSIYFLSSSQEKHLLQCP